MGEKSINSSAAAPTGIRFPALLKSALRLSVPLGLLLVLYLGWLGLCVLIGLPYGLALIPALLFPWAWRRWKPLRRYFVMEIVATFVVMLVWRAALTPSHDRPWAAGSERLAQGVLDGETMTIENVRDFSWQSDGSSTSSWQTRRYDLGELQTLDLWVHSLGGSSLVAHNMLTFGFGDDCLTVSVQARKEQGERFGLVSGAMNQFELFYLFVSEPDTLTKRAMVNGDPLYRFPVKATPEFLRSLFLEFVDSANALHGQPEFYLSLRNNCTTSLAQHADTHLDQKIGYNLDILFSGRAPHLLDEMGLLKKPLGDLAEYRQDELVRQHPNDPNLSALLRVNDQ